MGGEQWSAKDIMVRERYTRGRNGRRKTLKGGMNIGTRGIRVVFVLPFRNPGENKSANRNLICVRD